MAADNVKTDFRLPSGINKDFIRNLLWQYEQQKQLQENINQQQQQQNISRFTTEVFRDIHRKIPVLKSLFNKTLGL